MKQQLENIEAAAKQALADCGSIKGLDDLRVRFLGKKGELTGILKQMGGLSAEERPVKQPSGTSWQSSRHRNRR